MRRALLAAWWLVGAAALGQPVVLTGASAGSTWDSNATRSAQPEGGLFVDAHAHVGAGLVLAEERLLLTGLAVYRGSVGVTASMLTSHVASASLAGSVRLVPWLRLGLSTGGGYGVLPDPARSGPRFDARGFVRVAPTAWLVARAGYAWRLRAATDPAFTTAHHEVATRVEARPVPWLELSVDWAFTTGGDLIFVPASEGTGDTRGFRGGQAFSLGSGTTWTPAVVEARTHALTGGVFAELPKGFGVGVEVSWLTSENPVQPWSGWSASLQLAWELPD